MHLSAGSLLRDYCGSGKVNAQDPVNLMISCRHHFSPSS